MERFFQRLTVLIESSVLFLKACPLSEYTNTCILDSLLAAFHISYIVFPNVAKLLHGNDFFRDVISMIEQRKYEEARGLCVRKLKRENPDLFGHVEDYFPLMPMESPPNDWEIIREFQRFGKVFILGDPSDPPLILLHIDVPGVPSIKLPPQFNDVENERTFAIFFILTGKDKHMTMCFRSSETTWHLYDNDPTKPSFQPFNPDDLKNYMNCLVGYVNITQLEEYKGIPETGEGAGLSNQHDCQSQPFYPAPIPETGEGVGTRPFNRNRQDVYMNYSNQNQ